jgi:hypothetical protein
LPVVGLLEARLDRQVLRGDRGSERDVVSCMNFAEQLPPQLICVLSTLLGVPVTVPEPLRPIDGSCWIRFQPTSICAGSLPARVGFRAWRSG